MCKELIENRVIAWVLNPEQEPQPPIDYILALVNQSRERIEALSIDRELTLCALKSIPTLTCDSIWAGINHGLRMLPEHDPDIDDMTGTIVEVTEHIRELKDLIWRVQCVVKSDPALVKAYPMDPEITVFDYEPQRAVVKRAAERAARFEAEMGRWGGEESDSDSEPDLEMAPASGPTSHDGQWVDEEMERDNKERNIPNGGVA